MRFSPTILLLLCGLFVSLGGCSEEAPVTRGGRKAKTAKKAKAATPKAMSKMEIPSILGSGKDTYSYSPVGKRDPFQRFVGDTVQGPDLPRSPLERYDLDQLRVRAIIWGISSPRGLISAPDGQSYIVKKNMRMGKNRGRISRITRRQLFVEEEYRDPAGKLVVRETVLQIRPKEPKVKLRMSDE